MIAAAWAAVAVALVMAVGGVTGLIFRIGRRDATIDAVLARLTALTQDHEERIRELEHPK